MSEFTQARDAFFSNFGVDKIGPEQLGNLTAEQIKKGVKSIRASEQIVVQPGSGTEAMSGSTSAGDTRRTLITGIPWLYIGGAAVLAFLLFKRGGRR